jgi:transposase
MRQLNAMEYRSLNRRGAISFPENPRWKSIISFMRKGRKDNHDKATIIALDNLKSHKVEDVRAEVKGLGIGLVFLPP